MDGTIARPKIRACSVSNPFVLIFSEDDMIGLFIGETEQGKIRQKDIPLMGDKVSQCCGVGNKIIIMSAL
jgi:cleavage and polyadenylation specificity factor subunit 1